MSNKRVMSERGTVDQDFEPPLKVPNDSSIVIPSIRNVPLPSDTRERCVPGISPVAEPALEESGKIMEPAAGNQIEEQETQNQNEETVKESGKEKYTMGFNGEELPTQNKIEEAMEGCEEEEFARWSLMEELATRNQFEEIVSLTHIEEMLLGNENERAMRGNHIENLITGNQNEITMVDQMKQSVSNVRREEITPFVPEEVSPFEPEEITPFVSEEATPFEPEEITPFVSEEITLFEPEEITSFEQEEITPFVSEEITPFVSEKISPFVSEEITPFVSEEITPFVSEEITPFEPEEISPFEEKPVINQSDETLVFSTEANQPAVESRDLESSEKPVHERSYSFDRMIELSERGKPIGSTEPDSPTGKPVGNLMIAADNTVLHSQAAPTPAAAAVETRDQSGFVTAHSPFQLAAPENESGSRNDQPPLSKSEMYRAAALRRKALFLRAEQLHPKDDMLKERHFVRALVQPNEKLSFKVVSYNIMTGPEAGSQGTGSGTGKPGSDKFPSNYNERILVELFYLDSDILCLQSVTEKYWSKLESLLFNWGFKCSKTGGLRSGPNDLCEAICFRKSRFAVEKISRLYPDEVQLCMVPDVNYNPADRQSVGRRAVAAFVTLRCLVTGRRVTVANMRMVPEYKNRPYIQAAQVCCVVRKLADLSATPSGRMPTILCGDLDFQPTSAPYQVLRDGHISEETEHCFRSLESVVGKDDNRCPQSTVDPAVFCHPMPSIRSAYGKVFGSEPPNVWKRENETFVCSSYVWFDEAQLKLVGALDMVDSKAVTGSGIPNDFFPSGSLSLKASFQFCEDMPGTG